MPCLDSAGNPHQTQPTHKLTRPSLQFSDSAEDPFKALFMLSKSKTVGHPAMLFLCLNQLMPLTGRAVYRTARS